MDAKLHFQPLANSAPSKRRRAPARELQAAGNGRAIGTPATDGTAATSSKKTSRKEKQRQQQRLREREEQQLLLLRASLVEAGGEEDGDDDELPQVVFDRILRRILFTVGVPMASGVTLLNVYDALKRGRGVEVPPWVPLLTILVRGENGSDSDG